MDWPGKPADGPLQGLADVDPYAVWAAATQGVYLANRKQQHCRVALELLPAPDSTQQGKASVADLNQIAGVVVPRAYADTGSAFCTAQVAGSEPWAALHKLALVLLAEPGMAAPGQKVLGPKVKELPAMAAATIARPRPKGGAGQVVIGVVDGACGFVHRQFRRRDSAKSGAWASRLLAYWDQQGEPAAAVPWHQPQDFGYGRELTVQGEAGLDGLLARHLPAPDLDAKDREQARAEKAIYEALDIALPDAADWSHGTHVLDTAAGLMAGDTPDPKPDADVDAAGLVFVQLPEIALRDTSGRWCAALVLDGVRYIVARAPIEASIVVNLSLGSFAGPHDGSSMLERALDALVLELWPRLTIVVAAGNAGKPRNDGDGTPRPCHATARLAPAGADGARAFIELDMDLPDATETFTEIWVTSAAGVALAGVELRVQPPDGGPLLVAAPGNLASWIQGTNVLAQLFNNSNDRRVGPRGQTPMVLLSVGATRFAPGQRAPTGIWRIELANRGAEPVIAEAWVERRDVPGELPGERPQYKLRAGDGATLSAANTLGSLANGQLTIVATSADYSAQGTKVVAAEWPSQPPAREEPGRLLRGDGPAVVALGKFDAAGFLSGSRKDLQGTSMAAAWVTRRVAAQQLRLGSEPMDPRQIRTWLRDGARFSAAKGAPPASPSFVTPAPPPEPPDPP